MRLEIRTYPTTDDTTCAIVDLDRDGADGEPLIVARVFEPGYALKFLRAVDVPDPPQPPITTDCRGQRWIVGPGIAEPLL
jgi:hypothetical protein